MTVEQTLENRIVEHFEAAFAEAHINVQVMGVLQNVAEGLKGVEREDADGVMVVKARPRSYQTPSIPECQIQVDVSFTCRADKDFGGKTFADAFALLIGEFQNWQRCMDDAHTMFTVDGAFDCSGYALNEGDTFTDKAGKNWTYIHSMTIYGVVLYAEDASQETNN